MELHLPELPLTILNQILVSDLQHLVLYSGNRLSLEEEAVTENKVLEIRLEISAGK